MQYKRGTQKDLHSRLYLAKKQYNHLDDLFFWRANRKMVYLMHEFQDIKRLAKESREEDIFNECEEIEDRIKNSFSYRLKGKKLERVVMLEAQHESLDQKLEEISDFVESRVNTYERMEQAKEYCEETKYLKSSYKTLREKQKAKKSKKLKPRLKQGIKYYKFLEKANKDLDSLLEKYFKMNRKTDCHLRDSIFHYFRMKRFGKYSRIIENDFLKYHDQQNNPDLEEKISAKNQVLENLGEKVNSKINNVRNLLDANLDHISTFFLNRNKRYPEGFLKKQKFRLFFLTLKYNALGVDYSAEKARILTKEVKNHLYDLRLENKKSKEGITKYLPSA